MSRRPCAHCAKGRENLCLSARFTGYQIDGGYADYALADARFAFSLPDVYGNAEAILIARSDVPSFMNAITILPGYRHWCRR